MTVETATYVQSLDAANPASGDVLSEGDDHLRLNKSTLLNSFPSVDTRNLTEANTTLRFGQCIRWDGVGLNVNVRARFSEYPSTVDLTLPDGTYVTFAFPNTPTENGLALTWVTPGKFTIGANNKYLAFRLKGTVLVENPVLQDLVRVRVMKNAGTVVAGPYNFYLGQESLEITYSNLDIFQAIPIAGLVATDSLYFEIGYVTSGATPAQMKLLAGATIELYDMG